MFSDQKSTAKGEGNWGSDTRGSLQSNLLQLRFRVFIVRLIFRAIYRGLDLTCLSLSIGLKSFNFLKP